LHDFLLSRLFRQLAENDPNLLRTFLNTGLLGTLGLRQRYNATISSNKSKMTQNTTSVNNINRGATTSAAGARSADTNSTTIIIIAMIASTIISKKAVHSC